MKIAIAHHWFVTRGGGERVTECISALFPKAEVFTLVASPAGIPATLTHRKLHTSFLQRLPLGKTHHRHFLPLYPAATKSLDLRGFDLVLSSDSGPIKGVRLDPNAVHICYCHSPMRYLWDGYEQYRDGMYGLTRTAFTVVAPRIRSWDASAANRVTYFLANSNYVADRIRRCYHRDAQVLYPPIDLQRAETISQFSPSDNYLCAGRLVPYKRTEILIGACRSLRRNLRIVGAGPELARLQSLTDGDPKITFLGQLSTPDLWAEYAQCRALLFAADEDFGMVPLEAQACGRPVIAYGAGGSLETVRGANNQAERTGTYFYSQTAEAAARAILQWETEGEASFDPVHSRNWASSFSTPLFLEQFREFVLQHVPAAADQAISAREAAAIVAL